VPGAPTDVAATGGYSSIGVSWSAPAPNGVTITGYRASASPGPATCTAGPSATGCVIGAEAGTAYTVSVVALSAGGSSPASGPSPSVVPSAPAVSPTPPDTKLPLGTGNGPISSAAPGESLLVTGTGYAPYSSVTIAVYSSPQVLASVQADRRGDFEQPVTVPNGLRPGTHSFVAAGVDRNGRLRALRLDLTVARSSAGGSLPITGPAVLWLIVGGFALTLAGVAMRLVRRQ
jgi:fibronectin type III domain protein